MAEPERLELGQALAGVGEHWREMVPVGAELDEPRGGDSIERPPLWAHGIPQGWPTKLAKPSATCGSDAASAAKKSCAVALPHSCRWR